MAQNGRTIKKIKFNNYSKRTILNIFEFPKTWLAITFNNPAGNYML